MADVKLFITDIDIQKAKRYVNELKATFVDPDNIFNYNYNIVCPCDTEFTVTEKNISSIFTKQSKRALFQFSISPIIALNSLTLFILFSSFLATELYEIFNQRVTPILSPYDFLSCAEQLSTQASADKMAEEIITSSYEEKITA